MSLYHSDSSSVSSHSSGPSTEPSGLPLDCVPLLDLSRENLPLETSIVAAITEVTRSGRFVMGPECQQLEERIAAECDVAHAIGCASGTDALLLALLAVDLQPGDEVIVPSFTFFATASVVWRLGGVPVFADIEPDSFNLNPELVEAAITDKTKAIIPVHLFGQAAEMDAINEIARQRGLVVVEDAAQALGAKFAGRPVGSLGQMGCFSFYPTKNLGGFGDGGILTTNSDELAEKLRLLRVHGMRPRYYHAMVGVNSRLDTIQAAVLNVKLPKLASWTAARRENARRYQQLFERAGLAARLQLPRESPRCTHVWNQFTIRVPRGQRDPLRAFLAEHNVGTEIYYPVPLHQQACFRSLGGYKGRLPETDRAAEEALSLPIFPTMTPAEQQTVVMRVAEFFNAKANALPAAVLDLPASHATGQSLESI